MGIASGAALGNHAHDARSSVSAGDHRQAQLPEVTTHGVKLAVQAEGRWSKRPGLLGCEM